MASAAMPAAQPPEQMAGHSGPDGESGPGRRLEQELAALHRISLVLNSGAPPKTRLLKILALLQDLAGLSNGVIVIGTCHGERCDEILVRQEKAGPVTTALSAAFAELAGEVAKSGRVLIVPTLADDVRIADMPGRYDSRRPFIAVPIAPAGRHAVGVLAAQPGDGQGLAARARFMQLLVNLLTDAVRHPAENPPARALRDAPPPYAISTDISGGTPAMLQVFRQVRQVAGWHTTVLIRGESGTGKELIASAIHRHSACASGPFVKLNCAALAETLLESELFGHEKGAFSGALESRKGRFEMADGGTLFLDEIGDVSWEFQAKLLRVLQEGEFDRVGGSRPLKVRVRIIAATNRDLEASVRAGKFRADLYYRLNVMPIYLPPLRERTADIPELIEVFLRRIGHRQGGRALSIKDEAIAGLMDYHWPGNVRELENVLERASVMSRSGVLEPADLQLSDPLVAHQAALPRPPAVRHVRSDCSEDRARLIAAMEKSGWVQAKAARLLDMTPRMVGYRLKILNIPIRHM